MRKNEKTFIAYSLTTRIMAAGMSLYECHIIISSVNNTFIIITTFVVNIQSIYNNYIMIRVIYINVLFKHIIYI